MLRLEPGEATKMLDDCLGELSSRHNFGTLDLGQATRLVGTAVWGREDKVVKT